MSYNCGGKQGNTTRTFVKRWNAIITVVASLKLFFCLEGSSPSLSVWWHLKEEESGLKVEFHNSYLDNNIMQLLITVDSKTMGAIT